MSTKEESSSSDEVTQKPLAPAFSATADLETKRKLNEDRSNESITELQNVNNTLDMLMNISVENPHHPYHWATWKKYAIAVIYSLLQVTVTLTSTTYLGIEWWVELEFDVNAQTATLGQSMFIVGTAIGPAFLGPLSDIAGRKWVYVGSMVLFAIFNVGCALPKNMAMLAIFEFLSGVAGSTAMSNVAGTICDMFVDSPGASQAMGLFVMSANIGPSLGSPVGEWIGDNVNMGFRWVYYLNIIFGGAWAVILCILPETLPRIVIARETRKDVEVGAEIDQIAAYKPDVWGELRFATVMAIKILCTEPIVLSLGLYNGFAYGLLFLYLDGVFDVFAINNGLSYVSADLTYLNFIVGVFIMFALIPVQTYLYKKWTEKKGGAKPEFRFLLSLVTVWGFPISLFWFAFTSNGKTSYWSPVIAGTLLGISDPLLWLAMLNFITDSYPNVAGSAIAAFTIPSFLIAAALAHAGVAMFDNMSTTWAVATLAFISLGIVALVYIMFFFGPYLRKKSKLAR